MREIFGCKNPSTVSENEVTSVIIWCTDRMDFCLAKFWYSIHMCDKSKLFLVFISWCCCKDSINEAFVVQNNLVKSEFFQFISKDSCKIKLTLRGWNCIAVFIAWCFDCDVFE